MLGAVKVTTESLLPLMEKISFQYGVEPALMRAFITVESNWDINASRYEAHLNDTSWGLMQILLSTGKWILGDSSLTISKLIQPEVNLSAGTKYIRYLLDKYNGNVADSISAYNAGSPRKTSSGIYVNQAYVNKVYGYYVVYKTVGIFSSPVKTVGVGGIATLGLIGLIGLVVMDAK